MTHAVRAEAGAAAAGTAAEKRCMQFNSAMPPANHTAHHNSHLSNDGACNMGHSLHISHQAETYPTPDCSSYPVQHLLVCKGTLLQPVGHICCRRSVVAWVQQLIVKASYTADELLALQCK